MLPHCPDHKTFEVIGLNWISYIYLHVYCQRLSWQLDSLYACYKGALTKTKSLTSVRVWNEMKKNTFLYHERSFMNSSY